MSLSYATTRKICEHNIRTKQVVLYVLALHLSKAILVA
jgi:hypothetical protein